MDYEAAYSKLHANEKRFPGFSICQYTRPISALIEQHQPERLLDYGSGKGFQYLVRRVHEKWGGLLPHLYDIGVRQLRDRPEGVFGGVLNTDMLEHIERPDLAGIIDDLIGYVAPGGFLFLGIACRPSRKTLGLGDGRDVHVTVEHPDWWVHLVTERRTALRRGDVHIAAGFDNGDTYPEARREWDLPA